MIVVLVLGFLVSSFTTAQASTRFIDVPENYWAKMEIEYLVDTEIIKGYSDGTFKPERLVTRLQAAIMVVRALQLDTTNRPDPGFLDMKKGQYGYEYVAAVTDSSIFSFKGKFNPNQTLTRGEMAGILVKAFEVKGSYDGKISDVSGELLSYVSALASTGITKIYADHTFKPNDPIKRSSFAVFFARAKDPSFRVVNEMKATTEFLQGEGYLKGKYDLMAIQPTSSNWTRQSRFVGPENSTVNWTFDGYGFHGGLSMGRDGTIYVGDSLARQIIALHPNGREKWAYLLDDEVEIWTSPVIAEDGTIYVGVSLQFATKDTSICKLNTCKGALLALNPDGTLKWQATFAKDISGSHPVIDDKGNIYVGTGNYFDEGGILYAIDSAGKILWNFDTLNYGGEGIYTSPALTKSGYMFAHNLYFKERNFLKPYYMTQTSFSSPAIGSDETIYFGTYTGLLGAMNPNGTPKWRLRLNTTVSDYTQDDGSTVIVTSGANISASPVISEKGILYIGDEEGNLFSIKLKDVENAPKYEETFNGEKLYDELAFSDITKNDENWIVKTGGWITSALIGKDGTIYAGDMEGNMNAYRPDGSSIFSEKLNSGVIDMAIGSDGKLYVLTTYAVYSLGSN